MEETGVEGLEEGFELEEACGDDADSLRNLCAEDRGPEIEGGIVGGVCRYEICELSNGGNDDTVMLMLVFVAEVSHQVQSAHRIRSEKGNRTSDFFPLDSLIFHNTAIGSMINASSVMT